MFPAASLLTTLLLALSIAATPVEVRTTRVTLPLAKRINTNGGILDLVQHDRARAAALKDSVAAMQNGKLERRAGTPADNQGHFYVATVGVGSPATQYNLIVDTGSSNTWVGANTPYNPTSTSQNTGNTVSVSYGSSSFQGEEYIDTVDLGSGLVISQQSIGVASSATGFQDVDGILGIGPVDLTAGTVSNEHLVPTVTDNLFSAGTISSDVVALSFEPTASVPNQNGEITWGDTDSSKYTGSITYVPITSTSPASNFWGFDQTITYGSGTTILGTTAGIADTGTTLILLATDAFNAYKSATGATEDSTTGLLTLTSAGFDNLQSLYFHIGGTTFELTANGQIWPRSLNTYIGGSAGQIYLVVGDHGSPSGNGLDFLLGMTFFERFYLVLDTGNSQVGFATTPFTTATTN